MTINEYYSWTSPWIKVIRTLEPVDGEPLVLALVAPDYPFHQCRWAHGGLMPMADDDDRNDDSLLCILSPIARMTIPTSENGDVITVDVQDGLVFDSGVSRFTHIWIYDTVKHSEGEILTWVEAWDDNGQQTCGVRWGKYWLLLCHSVVEFERLIGAKGGFHFGHQQNSTLSVVCPESWVKRASLESQYWFSKLIIFEKHFYSIHYKKRWKGWLQSALNISLHFSLLKITLHNSNLNI